MRRGYQELDGMYDHQVSREQEWHSVFTRYIFGYPRSNGLSGIRYRNSIVLSGTLFMPELTTNSQSRSRPYYPAKPYRADRPRIPIVTYSVVSPGGCAMEERLCIRGGNECYIRLPGPIRDSCREPGIQWCCCPRIYTITR